MHTEITRRSIVTDPRVVNRHRGIDVCVSVPCHRLSKTFKSWLWGDGNRECRLPPVLNRLCESVRMVSEHKCTEVTLFMQCDVHDGEIVVNWVSAEAPGADDTVVHRTGREVCDLARDTFREVILGQAGVMQ